MKNLKVLMLNGSPHANGNTAVALREMEEAFKANGVEVETVLIGNQAVRGCTACGACYKLGKCVFDDVVNELKPKFEEADGLVVASPVYYASANATLVACLEQDGEGRQTMCTLARNMTFLMKSIALGKEQFGLPEKEERIATHFIR